MNEELYDPDCSACKRAQEDYAKLERVTDDLTALVARLAHSLRKAAPDNDLPAKALDYLCRKGLQGSPLRKVANLK
jgi:phage gpG-like protein